MRKIIGITIMWLCSILHKKYNDNVFILRGEGNAYPEYLVYTNNKIARKEIESFINKYKKTNKL